MHYTKNPIFVSFLSLALFSSLICSIPAHSSDDEISPADGPVLFEKRWDCDKCPAKTVTDTCTVTKTTTKVDTCTVTKTTTEIDTCTVTKTSTDTTKLTDTITKTCTETEYIYRTDTVVSKQTETNTVTNEKTKTNTVIDEKTNTVINEKTKTNTVINEKTKTNTVINEKTKTNTVINEKTKTDIVTNKETKTATVTDTVTKSVTDTVTKSVTDTITKSVTNTVTNKVTSTVTATTTVLPCNKPVRDTPCDSPMFKFVSPESGQILEKNKYFEVKYNITKLSGDQNGFLKDLQFYLVSSDLHCVNQTIARDADTTPTRVCDKSLQYTIPAYAKVPPGYYAMQVMYNFCNSTGDKDVCVFHDCKRGVVVK